MLNAVMIVKDRYRLTKQALDSFLTNSVLDWTLTIVDDGSRYQTERLLVNYVRPTVNVIRLHTPYGVLANLKNLGVYWSEKVFGRGDALYISDNDGYFTKGWDEKLVHMLMVGKDKFKLLGPYRHPYHHANDTYFETATILKSLVASTDAVQGLGHLMLWSTWDKFGPYEGHAVGTNKSEDYAFCRKIVEAGFLVGSIQPEVVYNCGLTSTDGGAAVGIEVMQRYDGVIME